MTYEQQLQSYADLAVKVGINIQPGQRFIIQAPLESAPLVRLITVGAYKAGAKLVNVIWSDDAIRLARFEHAPRDSFAEFFPWNTQALIDVSEGGGAALSIKSTNPDLLKDQDPDLVTLVQQTAQRHSVPFTKNVMSDAFNWGIISWPLASWAAKIFPDDPPDIQVEKLWAVIFKICRIDQPDPLAAWEQHLKKLAAMRAYLNAKQYATFKYRAPGTDLSIGLPSNHAWMGGQKATLNDIPFVPNIPTEEVFSTAHRDKVDGVVRASKPLSYAGTLIEDFSLTFEAGRVVKVSATKGEEMLQKLIDTDEGARRVGEVALVAHSSPISQTGLLFYNTLYDENAASHIALGRAYRFSIQGGSDMSEEEFIAAGGNNSLIHTDFMIGSDKMDIDGITASGNVEALMRAGEFCR